MEGGADGSGPHSSLCGEGVVAAGGEIFLWPERDRGTTRNDGRVRCPHRAMNGANTKLLTGGRGVEQRIAALACLAKGNRLLQGGKGDWGRFRARWRYLLSLHLFKY